MDTDWLFWGVAFLFFLPMHLGIPLLYLLLQYGPPGVRERLPRILLAGTLSAILAFALAIGLWPYSKTAAAVVIALSMLHPWLDLFLHRPKK